MTSRRRSGEFTKDKDRRQVCAQCDYAHTGPGLSCRRYPPLATAQNLASGEAEWPRVKVDDWCGEWTVRR
jgi:hypothetical protein